MYSSSIGLPGAGVGVVAGSSTLAMTGAGGTPVLVALGLALVVVGAALARVAYLRRTSPS
ncbi:hypothetical protein [Nostocoides sp. HKS02]|uniref:hypothetical protein n=1 Tax=Nostocoides sp. HKS02 TaxID=1813880 RepID=UPI0012B47684|nr:hypothetical protein [Tetrasphaera sp. HKS02]QGN58687.1 hypothetical protein GKE56_13290 [Tetrasphaera sp. HKS02]